MKSLICCTILLLICVLVQVQGGCNYGGETLPVGTSVRNCQQITCDANGNMGSTGCALWQCRPGTQIGTRPLDVTKPFPECCPGPICS